MCGFAALIGRSGKRVSPTLLKRMNDRIAHRGPDDEGYLFINRRDSTYRAHSGPQSPQAVQEALPALSLAADNYAEIGLAHRRFSILDLSPRGHQPMMDGTQTVAVSFNGEIYNYIEVREELQELGHQFRTTCDTEVLVEAYKEWNTACFDKFCGMWSLALYDFTRRELIISRDRLGKLPMYWAVTPEYICVASEIKSLLEVPGVWDAKKVNESVIYKFLTIGQRDPGPSTFFEGIQSFPSASWSVVDANFPHKICEYWSRPNNRLSEAEISIDEAAEQLRDRMRESVRIRMRADVDWCVELSGGLDSSVIMALAAESVGEGNLYAYTASYGDPRFDESSFAHSVASFVGAQHHIVKSPEVEFWREVGVFTRLQEEPYHSPVLHVNQMIRRQMRLQGMKVFFSGIGGDELFCGYKTHFAPSQIRNIRSLRLGDYLRNGLNWVESDRAVDGLKAPWSVASHAAQGTLKEFMKRAIGMGHVRRDVPAHIQLNTAIPHYDFGPGSWDIDTILNNMLRNTLVPYWLISSDKSNMGVPTETRIPFLDHRVVEFASMLPTSYMVRDGWHKWIVRKAFEKMLPRDVVWRRQKMGYPFPTGQFFSENKKLVDLIFAKSNNPFVRLDAFKQFDTGQACYLLSFLLWYESFIRDNDELFDGLARLAEERRGPPSGSTKNAVYLRSCATVA